MKSVSYTCANMFMRLCVYVFMCLCVYVFIVINNVDTFK
uniref:Uncharacterized protein n=1 Tax=Proteus mirabilis TaxID=584 RepID=A0A7L4ZCQ8_PROMI|nr:hypothetical protein [Proteus mirabilis]